jgi:hypothetical protein
MAHYTKKGGWIVTEWEHMDGRSRRFVTKATQGHPRHWYHHEVFVAAKFDGGDVVWTPWAPSRGMDGTCYREREDALRAADHNIKILTGQVEVKSRAPFGRGCP